MFKDCIVKWFECVLSFFFCRGCKEDGLGWELGICGWEIVWKKNIWLRNEILFIFKDIDSMFCWFFCILILEMVVDIGF